MRSSCGLLRERSWAVIFVGLSLALGSCKAEKQGPTPVVEELTPALVCGEQIETEVTISGADFSPLTIDAATSDSALAIPDVSLLRTQDLAGTIASGPSVIVPNDPKNPSNPARLHWTNDSQMSFTVYPDLGLEPGLYQVTVTNRNGRSGALASAITVVPRPKLVAIEPDLLCVSQGGKPLLLRGEGFLKIGDLLPQVTIGTLSLPVAAVENCIALPGPMMAETCTVGRLTVPEKALPGGKYEVTLTNPKTAACHSQESVTIAIVPNPVLDSVQPDLFCVDQENTFILKGTGFVGVDNKLSTVKFGDVEVAATSLSDCHPIDGTLTGARSCDTLEVTVPATKVPAGVAQVIVVNPDPPGCSSVPAKGILGVGAPVISAIDPPAYCTVAPPTEITIQGLGFLVLQGPPPVPPKVFVDQQEATLLSWDNCSPPLAGTSLSVIQCRSLTIAMPPAGFALGDHSVSVRNPAPADCTTAGNATFSVASTPQITSVVPFKVCANGGSFTVNGDGFVAGSQILVDLGGNPTPVLTQFVDVHSLTGTIPPAGVPAGLYDVIVTNGTNCEAVLVDAVRVVNAPFIFFIDPPMVYNGIEIEATIYASGISDNVVSVAIVRSGTADPPTEVTFKYDPARANRVLVNIPSGLDAGDYDVILEDAVCSTVFEGGLHITDTLAVDVAGIDPPFGWAGARTPVSIRSSAPPPQGFSNFVATPRAYLNPQTGTGIASPLKAVAFLDSLRLAGSVPEGLEVGTFDLIIINPDGGVGFLAGAFSVVADPAPEVTSISPASVPAQLARVVEIYGANFRTGVSVGGTCRTPGGGTVAPTATATLVDAGHIQSTWDMSGVASGSVCIVRVTNLDPTYTQGTYVDFSALMVTTPSGNPNAFQSSQPMTTGRRAAGAAALRMNSLERYLYAIGGDDGTDAGLRDSVDAARVDAVGTVEAFSLQRNGLPAGRSFTSAAAVGRHIYLPGGRTDTGATTSVLRAYLLDPFEALDIVDLDLALGNGAGLDGGIWYYRIAAVLSDADPNNPNGEGLASEPLVVELPSRAEKLHLTLYWPAVQNAVKYRIYRTPAADQASGDERLLTEVPAAGASPERFTDTGLAGDPNAAVPLPIGSLGRWHEVGPLNSPREGAGVVAVPNPAQPGVTHLYVFGGLSGGAAVATHEFATITTTASNRQTIGAFGNGASNLPDARWLLGAVYVDATRCTLVPAGDVWVYALPGQTAAGGQVRKVTAFKLDTANGQLGVGADNSTAPNWGGGYGHAAGSDYLYVFGGSGSPSAGGKSTLIDNPPETSNWNAGISMVVSRFLHASAAESGFVFLLGGQTDTEAATASTERTNF